MKFASIRDFACQAGKVWKILRTGRMTWCLRPTGSPLPFCTRGGRKEVWRRLSPVEDDLALRRPFLISIRGRSEKGLDSSPHGQIDDEIKGLPHRGGEERTHKSSEAQVRIVLDTNVLVVRSSPSAAKAARVLEKISKAR